MGLDGIGEDWMGLERIGWDCDYIISKM